MPTSPLEPTSALEPPPIFNRPLASAVRPPRHYGPGSLSHIICLLFSDLLNKKIQKYFAALYFSCDLFIQSTTTLSRPRTVSGAVPRKGLTTPLTRRVARCCYLCAVVVYLTLHGSPTGSIILVSSLREIPTTAVLHHPFLFGEIPT